MDIHPNTSLTGEKAKVRPLSIRVALSLRQGRTSVMLATHVALAFALPLQLPIFLFEQLSLFADTFRVG